MYSEAIQNPLLLRAHGLSRALQSNSAQLRIELVFPGSCKMMPCCRRTKLIIHFLIVQALVLWLRKLSLIYHETQTAVRSSNSSCHIFIAARPPPRLYAASPAATCARCSGTSGMCPPRVCPERPCRLYSLARCRASDSERCG